MDVGRVSTATFHMPATPNFLQGRDQHRYDGLRRIPGIPIKLPSLTSTRTERPFAPFKSLDAPRDKPALSPTSYRPSSGKDVSSSRLSPPRAPAKRARLDDNSIPAASGLQKYSITSPPVSSSETLPAMQTSPPLRRPESPQNQHSLPSLQTQLGALAGRPSLPPTPNATSVNHYSTGGPHAPPPRQEPILQGSHLPPVVTKRSSISAFGASEPAVVGSATSPSSRDSFIGRGDLRSYSSSSELGHGHSRYLSQGKTSPRESHGSPPHSAQQDSVLGTSEPPTRRSSLFDPERPFLPPIAAKSGQTSPGAYKCDHPGCPAPPFHTQYLLNSHAKVHSQNRPHYCPVKTCKRSEGGKGFKRKNEMIRHGLVHQSPGYICPFCPEKEHRYPRPDNLQRHVKAHHKDKDKDDPQLREVLAQRAEGGTRSRRRRVT